MNPITTRRSTRMRLWENAHSVFGVRDPGDRANGPGVWPKPVRDSTMSDVTWLPAPGIEGYEVSSDGRVRSLDCTRVINRGGLQYVASYEGQELKAPPDRQGYPQVVIRRKAYRVHQMVCKAFHGPRPDGQIVRHLNGRPQDNRAENLCWGTYSQNQFDRVAHGTHTEAMKTHCKWGHPFDEANTYRTNDGRACRTCGRNRMRRNYKQKNRDARRTQRVRRAV
jgi:hypothetical protein